MTFVTNPFTFPFWAVMANRTGAFVLNLDNAVGGDAAREIAHDGGALAGWFELAGVTAFGFVVLAIVSAAIGYLMASLIWRLMVARKRTKRLRDMAQRGDPLKGEAVGSEPTQGEA